MIFIELPNSGTISIAYVVTCKINEWIMFVIIPPSRKITQSSHDQSRRQTNVSPGGGPEDLQNILNCSCILPDLPGNSHYNPSIVFFRNAAYMRAFINVFVVGIKEHLCDHNSAETVEIQMLPFSSYSSSTPTNMLNTIYTSCFVLPYGTKILKHTTEWSNGNCNFRPTWP